MKKVHFASFCVLAAMAALPGCKQFAEARKAAESLKGAASAAASAIADGKAPAATSEEDKDAQLGDKLSEYISCLNYTSKRETESRSLYLTYIVNEKVGPTGKEPNHYAPMDVGAENCYGHLDKAKTLQPALPELEATAETYRKALQELDPVITEAAKYYQQEDYKDDKFAKAKALHPRLMSAYDKFEEANKAFENQVIALNDQVGARQFARLEKDPSRRLQYLSQKALNGAKALIKLADIRTLKELDQPKFEAAVQDYDKSVNELEQYASAHKAEVDKATMFSSYESQSDAFLKSCKELLRRKRDNKDFNKEFLSRDNPKSVDGHPAQIIDKYNSLIDASNDIRYGS
jgi:hypothetical protein